MKFDFNVNKNVTDFSLTLCVYVLLFFSLLPLMMTAAVVI